MTRTVVDIDDVKLSKVAQILGTKTKVSTVEAALDDVIKRHQRDTFVAWLKEGGLPDLTDPEAPEGRSRQTA